MAEGTMWEGRNEPVWRRVALFLLTLSLVVICALILHPFVSAIVGAVVLAVATHQPYVRLRRQIRNRNISAAVALAAVILSVIVPGFFLSQDLAVQALSIIGLLGKQSTQAAIAQFLANHPAVALQMRNLTHGMDMAQAARATAIFLATQLAALIGHSVVMITQLVVMLFLLFFLYRDGDQAVWFAGSLIPLEERETDELLARCRDTIDATVLGRVAVACVQGALSGLAFWVLGVQAPMLWAALTILTAMVPSFGAVLVWGPIALVLGLSGHWSKAAMLAVWGGLIVSMIDNFLYPMLVGTRLRHHTATVSLSILGGVALFGLTGIVLGPLTFTITATLLDFWRRRANSPSANRPMEVTERL